MAYADFSDTRFWGLIPARFDRPWPARVPCCSILWATTYVAHSAPPSLDTIVMHRRDAELSHPRLGSAASADERRRYPTRFNPAQSNVMCSSEVSRTEGGRLILRQLMVKEGLLKADQTVTSRLDGLQKRTPFAESFDREPPLRGRPIFPRPSRNSIHRGPPTLRRRSTTSLGVTPETPERLFLLRISDCARRDIRGCCPTRLSR